MGKSEHRVFGDCAQYIFSSNQVKNRKLTQAHLIGYTALKPAPIPQTFYKNRKWKQVGDFIHFFLTLTSFLKIYLTPLSTYMLDYVKLCEGK